MSQDFANSSARSECFYLNICDTTIKDGGDDNYNNRFAIRSALVVADRIQNTILPFNKFSFFEGLERNLLPPRQIKKSPKLTDDATVIYRDNGKKLVKLL